MLKAPRLLSLIFLSFSAHACTEDTANSGPSSGSSSGNLRSFHPGDYKDTVITLENGEELTGPVIGVEILETGPKGTLPHGSVDISIRAETRTGASAGVAVDFMDLQLFLQGSWKTKIGVGPGLAQASIGGALIPAGVVHYTRTDGRISGTVENDPDAPSDFPVEHKRTDQGMSFTGRFGVSCSVSDGGPDSGAYVLDKEFDTPFCRQFTDLGQPSTRE